MITGCVLLLATNKIKNKIIWKCEIFDNLVSSLFDYFDFCAEAFVPVC